MNVILVGGSSSIGLELWHEFEWRYSENRVLATHFAKPFTHANNGLPPTIRLDVTDDASVSVFADKVRSWGIPDVVVYLSAVLPGKALADYSGDQIDHVLSVNTGGAAKVAQALLPMMTGGQLILVGSVSGIRGSYDPIYAASKAALIGLTKSLAAWCTTNARVNCVAPSLVEESSMYTAMTLERRVHHKSSSPTKTLLTLKELAGAIVDLTGPSWKHLNGAVIEL